MSLRILLDLYAAAVGLIVGSYINVVVHRLPRHESTVRPRSHCPQCGAPIRLRDNLPLVSFLLLRGRCRECGARISWRYPLTEAASAALCVACVEHFGFRPQAAVAALFGCLLLVLAVIDFEHLMLPDRITLPGTALGLLLGLWLPRTFPDALIGALAGAGFLFLAAETWGWLRGEEGLGLGDAKLMAMIGAFLGWQGALVSLFFAALSGSLVGIFLVLIGRVRFSGTRLPFGSFLALGGLLALFFGARLIALYSGFL